MFENIEIWLKRFAKILFWFLLIVGIIFILRGFIGMSRVATKYDLTYGEIMKYTQEDANYGESRGYSWYVDGYAGKEAFLSGTVLLGSAFGALFIYAFGVLIEEEKDIRRALIQLSADSTTKLIIERK